MTIKLKPNIIIVSYCYPEYSNIETFCDHMQRDFLDGEQNVILAVTTKLMSQLDVDIGYQAEQKKRDHLLKYMPKREDLPPRSMGESFIMATIPLRTDKPMQEKYVSNVGTVRSGRLVEAMDYFEIWVCQQYIKIPNLPPNELLLYIFVNIIVNSMSILGQLPSYDKEYLRTTS
uniref:Uncharacterized protein n=1 Tax=Glossina austeni TaxID=7395 RepID=A0A1A9VAR6_GLOAU